uniref:Uncharacterized protein n=1 Tax=Lygus hesperus TaxID=30085 RepID=A0A0A9WXC2_LYGHE
MSHHNSYAGSSIHKQSTPRRHTSKGVSLSSLGSGSTMSVSRLPPPPRRLTSVRPDSGLPQFGSQQSLTAIQGNFAHDILSPSSHWLSRLKVDKSKETVKSRNACFNNAYEVVDSKRVEKTRQQSDRRHCHDNDYQPEVGSIKGTHEHKNDSQAPSELNVIAKEKMHSSLAIYSAIGLPLF